MIDISGLKKKDNIKDQVLSKTKEILYALCCIEA